MSGGWLWGSHVAFTFWHSLIWLNWTLCGFLDFDMKILSYHFHWRSSLQYLWHLKLKYKLLRSFSMPIYVITISKRIILFSHKHHTFWIIRQALMTFWLIKSHYHFDACKKNPQIFWDQNNILQIFCWVSLRGISFPCNAAHFNINPKGSIIPLHKIWLSGVYFTF